MAALAGDLSKQILGHSDATKAFRPWWDVVQDGIMYSLVVMGKLCASSLAPVVLCRSVIWSILFWFQVDPVQVFKYIVNRFYVNLLLDKAVCVPYNR